MAKQKGSESSRAFSDSAIALDTCGEKCESKKTSRWCPKVSYVGI